MLAWDQPATRQAHDVATSLFQQEQMGVPRLPSAFCGAKLISKVAKLSVISSSGGYPAGAVEGRSAMLATLTSVIRTLIGSIMLAPGRLSVMTASAECLPVTSSAKSWGLAC